jgi:hypothetical protein
MKETCRDKEGERNEKKNREKEGEREREIRRKRGEREREECRGRKNLKIMLRYRMR